MIDIPNPFAARPQTHVTAMIQLVDTEPSPITGKPVVKRVRVMQFPPDRTLQFLAEQFAVEVDPKEMANDAIRKMQGE